MALFLFPEHRWWILVFDGTALILSSFQLALQLALTLREASTSWSGTCVTFRSLRTTYGSALESDLAVVYKPLFGVLGWMIAEQTEMFFLYISSRVTCYLTG
jgi:hypothetical protein